METLPGETPIDDLSGLKVKGITTRKELDDCESANIRKVVAKYFNRRPTRRTARFDLSWALRLHREMFGDVWKWAGTVRTCKLNIGIPWHLVEVGLQTLLENLAYWEEHGTDLLEQAVLLHHQAVHIHPFLNGNGRWARMLANVWLALHKHAPTEWPEETLGTQSIIRDQYLTAIKKADEGDYEALTELHRQLTPKD